MSCLPALPERPPTMPKSHLERIIDSVASLGFRLWQEKAEEAGREVYPPVSVEEVIDQHDNLMTTLAMEDILKGDGKARIVWVDGHVMDIQNWGLSGISVAVPYQSRDLMVLCLFDGRHRNRLLEYNRGDRITLLGELKNIDRYKIGLENCEFEDGDENAES